MNIEHEIVWAKYVSLAQKTARIGGYSPKNRGMKNFVRNEFKSELVQF